jgi:hypothetical protein
MPVPKLTHYLGPLNKSYGYSIDYAAPIEQVKAASKKTGKEMWDALEACTWLAVEDLDESTIGGTHVDGDTLRLSPMPFDFAGYADEDDEEDGDDEEE